MSQPKTKPCRCGRGAIMTGRHSQFNAKDKKGRAICATCVMDQVLAPFTDKKEK